MECVEGLTLERTAAQGRTTIGECDDANAPTNCAEGSYVLHRGGREGQVSCICVTSCAETGLCGTEAVCVELSTADGETEDVCIDAGWPVCYADGG